MVARKHAYEPLVTRYCLFCKTPHDATDSDVKEAGCPECGSPLFAPYGGYVGTVAFYGVLWGVPAGSAVVVFSNFTQMKQDLGYLRLF